MRVPRYFVSIHYNIIIARLQLNLYNSRLVQ